MSPETCTSPSRLVSGKSSRSNLTPLTVPQIAQLRPASRQRMRRLADELAAEGLATFIENPKHRRSKLMQLTRKGDARYRELNARFLVIASTIGGALSEADIRKSSEVVRQLSDEVKERSGDSRSLRRGKTRVGPLD
jgi:DNA-binding MarR family transcriptional regulator